MIVAKLDESSIAGQGGIDLGSPEIDAPTQAGSLAEALRSEHANGRQTTNSMMAVDHDGNCGIENRQPYGEGAQGKMNAAFDGAVGVFLRFANIQENAARVFA